jgi:cyclopropane fatty-acyl-phospholipid synthase-like methyltransferase
MEKFYGTGYMSSGGEVDSKDFGRRLSLSPGDNVLDVGSGLGGFAFYLAQHYGVQVIGIDIEEELIRIAQERCIGMGISHKVSQHAQMQALSHME